MCKWLGSRMNVPLRAKLSTLVVEISNALVDIRMLPTQDILKLPKTVQEIFAATGLILEHLREGHTYGTGPWDQSLAGRRLLGPLAIVPLIFSFYSLVVDVIYILIYIYIYWKTGAITPPLSWVPNRSESGPHESC
jgi:hypothetical protein